MNENLEVTMTQEQEDCFWNLQAEMSAQDNSLELFPMWEGSF